MYMTEKEISIDMNPGSSINKKITPSFHRPLQVYSKSFAKYGFAKNPAKRLSARKNLPGRRRRLFPARRFPHGL